ncbi:MAG: hypothetical protein IJ305_03215 [Oscillospiraceae bacterium]|nr:hypothetical protein [Oscillospiraceae bacterium]
MKLRGLRFSLSEHIPAARWCLAFAVIAFTAVVSVHKYVDMAGMVTFSTMEVLFLILTDVMNIVFIYLPLYLFVVCGIMFDSGFGGIEILRCGSRTNWLAAKLVTYLVNSLIFFGAIFAINLIVCSRAFNFSNVWSGDFVGFRVMSGQPTTDFTTAPVPTIIAASAAILMFYVLCGTVNMLVSLATDRESAALFVSLFVGIALGLGNMLVMTNSAESQLLRCLVLAASSAAMYVFCVAAVRKKDFGGKKLY